MFPSQVTFEKDWGWIFHTKGMKRLAPFDWANGSLDSSAKFSQTAVLADFFFPLWQQID